jgi:hypothetical protein
MVLIDLLRAFDTVDHQILRQKLRCKGVKEVKWFESYLTGTESQLLNITYGVPEENILEPLLFLYYVNDMSLSVLHPTANSCYMPTTAP